MIERVNYWGALRHGRRYLSPWRSCSQSYAVLVPVPAPKVHKVHVAVPYKVGSFLAAVPPNGIGNAGVNTKTILFWADNFYTKASAIQAAGETKSAAEIGTHDEGVGRDRGYGERAEGCRGEEDSRQSRGQ